MYPIDKLECLKGNNLNNLAKNVLLSMESKQREFQENFKMAREYFHKRDMDLASYHLSQSINIKKNSPEAHKLLGEIWEWLGDKRQAILAFKESIKFDPTNSELVLRVCHLLNEEDDLILELSVYQQLCKLGEEVDPSHPAVIRLKKKLTSLNTSCDLDDSRSSQVLPMCHNYRSFRNKSKEHKVINSEEPGTIAESNLVRLSEDVTKAHSKMELLIKEIERLTESLHPKARYYSNNITLQSFENTDLKSMHTPLNRPVKTESTGFENKFSTCCNTTHYSQNLSNAAPLSFFNSYNFPNHYPVFQMPLGFTPNMNLLLIEEPYASMGPQKSGLGVMKQKARKSYRTKRSSCRNSQIKDPNDSNLQTTSFEETHKYSDAIPTDVGFVTHQILSNSNNSFKLDENNVHKIIRPSEATVLLKSDIGDSLEENKKKDSNQMSKIKLRPSKLSTIIQKQSQASTENCSVLEPEAIPKVVSTNKDESNSDVQEIINSLTSISLHSESNSGEQIVKKNLVVTYNSEFLNLATTCGNTSVLSHSQTPCSSNDKSISSPCSVMDMNLFNLESINHITPLESTVDSNNCFVDIEHKGPLTPQNTLISSSLNEVSSGNDLELVNPNCGNNCKQPTLKSTEPSGYFNIAETLKENLPKPSTFTSSSVNEVSSGNDLELVNPNCDNNCKQPTLEPTYPNSYFTIADNPKEHLSEPSTCISSSVNEVSSGHDLELVNPNCDNDCKQPTLESTEPDGCFTIVENPKEHLSEPSTFISSSVNEVLSGNDLELVNPNCDSNCKQPTFEPTEPNGYITIAENPKEHLTASSTFISTSTEEGHSGNHLLVSPNCDVSCKPELRTDSEAIPSIVKKFLIIPNKAEQIVGQDDVDNFFLPNQTKALDPSHYDMCNTKENIKGFNKKLEVRSIDLVDDHKHLVTTTNNLEMKSFESSSKILELKNQFTNNNYISKGNNVFPFGLKNSISSSTFECLDIFTENEVSTSSLTLQNENSELQSLTSSPSPCKSMNETEDDSITSIESEDIECKQPAMPNNITTLNQHTDPKTGSSSELSENDYFAFDSDKEKIGNYHSTSLKSETVQIREEVTSNNSSTKNSTKGNNGSVPQGTDNYLNFTGKLLRLNSEESENTPVPLTNVKSVDTIGSTNISFEISLEETSVSELVNSIKCGLLDIYKSQSELQSQHSIDHFEVNYHSLPKSVTQDNALGDLQLSTQRRGCTNFSEPTENPDKLITFNSQSENLKIESSQNQGKEVLIIEAETRNAGQIEPLNQAAANDHSALVATNLGRLFSFHTKLCLLHDSLSLNTSSRLSDSGYTSPVCYETPFLDAIEDFDTVARNLIGQLTLTSNFSHVTGTQLPFLHPFCNCVLVQFLSAVLRDASVCSSPFNRVLDLKTFLNRLRTVHNCIGSHRSKTLFILSICKADNLLS